MDDGSALTGTHTFTNADATVAIRSTYTTELASTLLYLIGGVKGEYYQLHLTHH